jgi:hypothetical protein
MENSNPEILAEKEKEKKTRKKYTEEELKERIKASKRKYNHKNYERNKEKLIEIQKEYYFNVCKINPEKMKHINELKRQQNRRRKWGTDDLDKIKDIKEKLKSLKDDMIKGLETQ